MLLEKVEKLQKKKWHVDIIWKLKTNETRRKILRDFCKKFKTKRNQNSYRRRFLNSILIYIIWYILSLYPRSEDSFLFQWLQSCCGQNLVWPKLEANSTLWLKINDQLVWEFDSLVWDNSSEQFLCSFLSIRLWWTSYLYFVLPNQKIMKKKNTSLIFSLTFSHKLNKKPTKTIPKFFKREFLVKFWFALWLLFEANTILPRKIKMKQLLTRTIIKTK